MYFLPIPKTIIIFSNTMITEILKLFTVALLIVQKSFCFKIVIVILEQKFNVLKTIKKELQIFL